MPQTKKQKEEKPITFICKWCKKQVCGAQDTDANLRKHRAGSNQKGFNGAGCPKRNLAIQAGASLPPTLDESKALASSENDQNGAKKLTTYFGRTEKFDKKVLNQILMIWQTYNALPWSRIEDLHLKTAFHYTLPDASLFKRKWSATESKQLYQSLQKGMLDKLKVRNIIFQLIKNPVS